MRGCFFKQNEDDKKEKGLTEEPFICVLFFIDFLLFFFFVHQTGLRSGRFCVIILV
nr:MAG TPA: hypothetical protein [Caudoviricetes sp.]